MFDKLPVEIICMIFCYLYELKSIIRFSRINKRVQNIYVHHHNTIICQAYSNKLPIMPIIFHPHEGVDNEVPDINAFLGLPLQDVFHVLPRINKKYKIPKIQSLVLDNVIYDKLSDHNYEKWKNMVPNNGIIPYNVAAFFDNELPYLKHLTIKSNDVVSFIPNTVITLRANNIIFDQKYNLMTLRVMNNTHNGPKYNLNINEIMIEILQFSLNKYNIPNFLEMINLKTLALFDMRDSVIQIPDNVVNYHGYNCRGELPKQLKLLELHITNTIDGLEQIAEMTCLERLSIHIKSNVFINIENKYLKKIDILLYNIPDVGSNFYFPHAKDVSIYIVDINIIWRATIFTSHFLKQYSELNELEIILQPTGNSNLVIPLVKNGELGYICVPFLHVKKISYCQYLSLFTKDQTSYNEDISTYSRIPKTTKKLIYYGTDGDFIIGNYPALQDVTLVTNTFTKITVLSQNIDDLYIYCHHHLTTDNLILQNYDIDRLYVNVLSFDLSHVSVNEFKCYNNKNNENKPPKNMKILHISGCHLTDNLITDTLETIIIDAGSTVEINSFKQIKQIKVHHKIDISHINKDFFCDVVYI